MLLGAQYYRPPFPDRNYWADDMARMKDAGLNTVQHWVVWSWVEPKPGEFQFDDYDELVSLAEKNHLQLVLSTIAEIHPYWIHRVVPGSEMIDHMGRVVVSSNRCEIHNGLTPGGCFDHPGVWERMSRFLTETVTRYRGSKALAGWDAWNELRWNVQADGYVCYCPDTLKAYRSWLNDRFGGLDGLNRAWRRRYDCWSDVLPGKLPDRPYTEMMSFLHFLTWRSNRHGKARYDLMKGLDPNHPVTLHAGEPCTVMTGGGFEHTGDRGNDWDFADDCDGIGTSSFPNCWGDGEEFVPVRVESVLSAARGKRIWMSELQGGKASVGFEVYPPVLAADQQRWLYHGVSRGAEAILFWCWRNEVFGRESGGFGMIGNDGFAEERLAAMAKTGTWLKEHETLLSDYRPSPSRAGVWFSPRTYYLHWSQEGHAGKPIDALNGYMKHLIRSSIPPRVVEENHLDALQGLDVLFLPRTLVLDDSAIDAITRWTQAGGTLVCESECGAFDSVGIYRYPEDRFLAKWGIQEVGRRVPDAETIRFQMEGKEYTLPFKQWWTPLRTADGGESIFVDQPAGKGRVIVIGTYLGQACCRSHSPAFQAMLRQITGSGPVEILSPDPTAEFSVYARTGLSGDKKLIFVFNTAQTNEIRLRLQPAFAGGRELHDLLTHQVYQLKPTDTGAEGAVETNPWGLAVLVVR
ncbi:MAG: beta-galactosidase [Phycisphaerae bacterium]|nr:beta-galactosidase [Phycisphaerae bacterium]